MFTTSGRHKQTTRRGGGDTAPRKEKVHTMAKITEVRFFDTYENGVTEMVTVTYDSKRTHWHTRNSLPHTVEEWLKDKRGIEFYNDFWHRTEKMFQADEDIERWLEYLSGKPLGAPAKWEVIPVGEY